LKRGDLVLTSEKKVLRVPEDFAKNEEEACVLDSGYASTNNTELSRKSGIRLAEAEDA